MGVSWCHTFLSNSSVLKGVDISFSLSAHSYIFINTISNLLKFIEKLGMKLGEVILHFLNELNQNMLEYTVKTACLYCQSKVVAKSSQCHLPGMQFANGLFLWLFFSSILLKTFHNWICQRGSHSSALPYHKKTSSAAVLPYFISFLPITNILC